MHEPLLQYLILNIFISSHQRGFLAKHSTGSRLLETVNVITEAVENGDCVDVCYIDFSKAFDTVSIPKLIQKLKFYGLFDKYLNWLTIFLSNRTMHEGKVHPI